MKERSKGLYASDTHSDSSGADNYNSMLQAYYCDLLRQEKAGAVTPATHLALETFLEELRTLVAEVHSNRLDEGDLAKAA